MKEEKERKRKYLKKFANVGNLMKKTRNRLKKRRVQRRLSSHEFRRVPPSKPRAVEGGDGEVCNSANGAQTSR